MRDRFLYLFFLLFSIFRAYAGEQSPSELYEKGTAILYTNPTLAIYYGEQVLTKLPPGSRSSLRAGTLLLLAQAEKLVGDFDSSMKYLYDGLDACPEQDADLEGQLCNQASFTYSTMGDHNKAIEFNDKATALYKAASDSLKLADCYNTRGLIHCNLHEFREAEQFLQKSLALNRRFKNLKSVAANLNNLCLYEGDLEEKLGYINEAISINKNLLSNWSLGENYNNRGKQYYYAGRYEEALNSLFTAREIARSIESKELICDNYEYLSWVYYGMKAYQKAYDCQSELMALREELQSANKLRNIEQSVIQKRLEAKTQENRLRQKEFEIALWRRNTILLIAALAILVILVAYISLWYKRRKNIELMESRYQLEQSQREIAELKVRQHKQELETVTEERDINRHELTTFAMFLCSRNELLEKIREMVREGYRLPGAELTVHLKKINTFIGQCQSNDKTNSSVLAGIEEKNAEFIARLVRAHPELTSGERHLATLLRVNLSTKDISLLTGRLPKTVNMNRYRLRKSLELENDTDLVDYLQKI